MRVCVMLKCTSPDGKAGEPRVISRWDHWRYRLSIGETYYLWDELFYFEEAGTFVIKDIIHMKVQRSLWERLCGKPEEVTMIMFETDDVAVLKWARENDSRWQIRDIISV